MAEVDAEVKAFFKKYSTEAEPSEHFPLMELPAYDAEQKLANAEVFYQSEKGYDDNDGVQLGKAIAVMKPLTLKQIYLSKNQIGDAGAIGLAAGLKEMEAMDTLHIADNVIGDAGMAALSASIGHLGCHTLVFTRNLFGDEGAIAFATAFADPELFKNLDWLFLNECKIGDKGAVAIADAMLTGVCVAPDSMLTRMALQGNLIGDDGAKAIATAFNKGALAQTGEFFYFQDNPLTDEGKEVLAKACRGKIRVHLGWPPPLGALEPEDWDR